MSTPPSKRAKLLVDQCAAIVLDAVKQYGAVASRVAGEIDRGDFGAKEWFRSMTQLWDVAAINSAAFAMSVAAGPGAQSAPKTATSDVATLPKANHPRILYIVEDFKLLGSSAAVPGHRVRFIPNGGHDGKSNPFGLLSAEQQDFQVEIHLAGFPGGTYRGEVRARAQAAAPDPQKDEPATIYVVW